MTEYSNTPEDWGGLDALETVWYAHYRYAEAKTLGDQAHWYIELSNAIGDLKTWHPKYNMDTGEIDGVIDYEGEYND